MDFAHISKGEFVFFKGFIGETATEVSFGVGGVEGNGMAAIIDDSLVVVMLTKTLSAVSVTFGDEFGRDFVFELLGHADSTRKVFDGEKIIGGGIGRDTVGFGSFDSGYGLAGFGVFSFFLRSPNGFTFFLFL